MSEVDYGHDVCGECGRVLAMPSDPRKAPRHLCGRAGYLAALEIELRAALEINAFRESRRAYQHQRSTIEITEIYEAHLRTKALLDMNDLGIVSEQRDNAKARADGLSIVEARKLLAATILTRALESGLPHLVDMPEKDKEP